ncbi:MAG: hypothetical protein R3B57_01890 [Phycisphaerales bacterium]
MYDPPMYADQQPRKGGGMKKVLLVLGAIGGVVMLVCGGVIVALVVWAATMPEGGVRLGHEMEAYAQTYITDHHLLEDGESIVAYYDLTLSLNANESVILTDKRLIQHDGDNVRSMPLDAIVEIVCTTQPLIGYSFMVSDLDGGMMVVEVAPLNGGERLAVALRNTTGLSVDCAD